MFFEGQKENFHAIFKKNSFLKENKNKQVTSSFCDRILELAPKR